MLGNYENFKLFVLRLARGFKRMTRIFADSNSFLIDNEVHAMVQKLKKGIIVFQ